MHKFETNPLTISGVFKKGWYLYKESIIYLLLPSFIVSIIHIIPGLFGFVGFYQRNMEGQLIFSWWSLFIFALLLIPEAYFVGVLFYSMYLKTAEQKVELKNVLSYAKTILAPLYLAMVLYFAAISIGLMLVIIPGILASVLFVLFLPLIVVEKQTVYQSFENSARLVWGQWWKTFLILAIPFTFTYLVRHMNKYTAGVGEWGQLIDIIVMTAVMPYFYTLLLAQYYNLKVIQSLRSVVHAP